MKTMISPRGRPRKSGSSSTGHGTEADILAASARLFCTLGYGSTSTHRIAEEAGIRQATIYHYFAGKHAILLDLLRSTVAPSLAVAEQLATRSEPAPVRLWALCVSDVRLLSSGGLNLGALYLLPELTDPRFADFHDQRTHLRQAYRHLVSAFPAVSAEQADPTADLVLALVESVILRRRVEPRLEDADLAPRIADAALRILEVPTDSVGTVREQGSRLLAQLSAPGP